jgi:hypothetical protein
MNTLSPAIASRIPTCGRSYCGSFACRDGMAREYAHGGLQALPSAYRSSLRGGLSGWCRGWCKSGAAGSRKQWQRIAANERRHWA